MSKIVILMNLKDSYIDRIRETAPGWHVIYGKDRAQWEQSLQEAEIVVGWRADAEDALLSPQAKMKWLQNWGAGVDHLPLQKLHEKEVIITGASGVHPYPISETIFGMMLSLTRQIHIYIRNQMQKKWDHSGLKLEMHGKTVGIVGVGSIGKETARIAKAFGMRVLGVRRSGEPVSDVDVMYTIDQLLEMLPQCDYIVVTIPLTEQTRHMFGSREFEAMKRTAFFINIGRGGTVDTNALVNALRSGQLAGAGLDVFEEEPLPAEHPLWEMENVIVTPHTSGSTEHYHDRAMDIFITNLADYTSGKQPSLNRVEKDKNY
ncbi:D-2-hydroxyacid dehydrogenase [Paenibacillus alkalitolerans]|uniref:D-2-hydroxyacid dehydrogenase n=1 Tax=Paenibacillus alkalitolerans TaxID=2799335 RepID=UPI00389909D1